VNLGAFELEIEIWTEEVVTWAEEIGGKLWRKRDKSRGPGRGKASKHRFRFAHPPSQWHRSLFLSFFF
jgi:hypothetical protein